MMRVRHVALAISGLLFSAALTQPSLAQKRAVMTTQAAASEAVSFDVFLPQQHRQALEALLAELNNPSSASYHQWLTPAQVEARFGASPAKVAALQKELANFGLSATQTTPHLLHVTGTASAAQAALLTRLLHAKDAHGRAVVVAATAPQPLASMQALGAMVVGLSGTPRMHHSAQRQALPENRSSPYGDYWFDDLRQAYAWPSVKRLSGKGSTIAVLVDGGLSVQDMALYFKHESVPVPRLSEVLVNGGTAYDPNGDGTFEAALDLQQTGGMAPDANIILYSLPDLYDSSIVAGLSQILQDNKADVVNMSFGGAELGYTAAFNDGTDYTSILRAEDDLFAEGNAQGITFVASSGDQGALSIPAAACFSTTATPCGAYLATVNFPASSPHVTGVGGTNLTTTYSAGSLNSAYVSEQAFGNPLTEDIFYGTSATGGYWGSGGGDSIIFGQPSFQKLVDTGNAAVRTVPDLSLHMGGCPGGSVCTGQESADVVAVGGGLYGVIGTSASAPDFAGLTALNVQRFGSRVGNENGYIYRLAALQNAGLVAPVYHRSIPGYNGLYSSGNDGYNRVLGNGTVYGKDFLLAPNFPSAGSPQTPSNP